MHPRDRGAPVALVKETLAIRVRLRLVTRWKVSDPDVRVLRLRVESQLDLSLGRLLAG